LPLIEVMWADGKNQAAEMSLLYEYVIKHLAWLNQEAAGMEVISVEEANNFLERFAHRRPDPRLLAALREFTDYFYFSNSDPNVVRARKQTIMDLCMDIAAAAVTQYPYEQHNRVMIKEKELLHDLMKSFGITPESPAPNHP
jgi:hypothetical protein